MRHAPLEAAHAHRAEGTLDAMVQLRLGHAHVDGPEGHVLPHGGAEELVVGVLEDETDRGADALDGGRLHGRAIDADAAVAAAEDAVEVQQQRGLAGTVGPHQGDLLAGLDGELDATQRLGAIGIGEVEVLDERCARQRSWAQSSQGPEVGGDDEERDGRQRDARTRSGCAGRAAASSVLWKVPAKPRASMAA